MNGRGVVGEYKGTALADGYALTDGPALNLSKKDQEWSGIKEAFSLNF